MLQHSLGDLVGYPPAVLQNAVFTIMIWVYEAVVARGLDARELGVELLTGEAQVRHPRYAVLWLLLLELKHSCHQLDV